MGVEMDAILAIVALVAVLVGTLVAYAAITARRVEQAIPPQGSFIEINGCTINYLDVGSGPSIILIHGLAGQILNFNYGLVDRLADEFRVIVLNRPGSGYSTRPAYDKPARLRAQGDLVAKFIATLGLDRPLLVGHSLGGGLSLAVALDHPESVGGLALLAPLTHPMSAPPGPFRDFEIRSKFLRTLVAWTLATPMTNFKRDAVLSVLFGPDPVPEDFATRGGGLLALRPKSFCTTSVDLLASNADLPSMVERYPSMRPPVSILYGTGDQILDYRAHGVAMKEAVPSLNLELIAGGHMLPVSHVEEAADFIRRAMQARLQ
jgi:pimeloyl-ACP methyl ester carboxylesterase